MNIDGRMNNSNKDFAQNSHRTVFATSNDIPPDLRLSNEHELDEVNINWCRFIARIISIVLLALIIICFALGAIKYKNRKLFILAGIIAVLLGIVFIVSFMDIESLKSRYIVTFYSHFRGRTNENMNTSLLSEAERSNVNRI